jgi:4-diphosphocytidyl-2-C-methyl-D-erythritol kinase
MRLQRNATYIQIEAPAKLNLFFEVLEKRSDGFHEIETLMAPTNLSDTLMFAPEQASAAQHHVAGGRPSPGEILLECRWADPGVAIADGVACKLGTLPPPAENLVVRAAELLRRRAGVTAGATIRLLKRIPAAAGLGGGSSDAAAALVAGNLGWGIDWPHERLAELATELGSDVPFFLQDGAAICRGRGERIEPIGGLSRLHVVVARPPEGLSTAEVYRRCAPGKSQRAVEPLIDALRRGDLRKLGRLIYNRLEEPAAELSDWVARLKSEFAQLGCLAAQMSGSGTSYFGLCHHGVHARQVAGRLRARGVGRVYALLV